MVSVTDSRRFDASGPALSKSGAGHGLVEAGTVRLRRRRRFSPLALRVLAINAVPLVLFVAGIFYLDRYQDRLIAAEIEALKTQARVFAGALVEGGVRTDADDHLVLIPDAATSVLTRLVEAADRRARLFARDGSLVADSRKILGERVIKVEALPPPSVNPLFRIAEYLHDEITVRLPARTGMPLYIEPDLQRAEDYEDVMAALRGEVGATVWRTREDGLLLTAAVPVQHLKQVLGTVVLSYDGDVIDAAVRQVRLEIISMLALALTATILLSLYFAGTMVRPIRKLAAAAERVRRGHGFQQEIPDFQNRRDEIGDLSGALRDMTEALRDRMVAIERFAADVAHEIKNPLTSLRSAVETASRIKETERRDALMAIILEDVRRIDRLISDISRASRLDAELSRSAPEEIDLGHMLRMLVESHNMTRTDEGSPRLDLATPPTAGLFVSGIEDRLVQVFQNLISNAVSFSPTDGTVTIRAQVVHGDEIEAQVIDEGPGIPEGKEEAIFNRFYSERPADEKFGTHSGLGLSICQQIVEAHDGRIQARNRYGKDGLVLGAVFSIRLPRAKRPR